MAETAPAPCAFLDRDGTINVEVDYLSDPADLALIEGSGRALRLLKDAGYTICVVTNQSGIARGMLDEARLAEIHRALDDELVRDGGVAPDGYYHCPHHPTIGEPPYRADCPCRKPLPGMLENAIAEHGCDLSKSVVIGDSLRDLEAGNALGVPGVLVLTGKGRAQLAAVQERGEAAPTTAENLLAAVEAFLAQGR